MGSATCFLTPEEHFPQLLGKFLIEIPGYFFLSWGVLNDCFVSKRKQESC